MVLHGVGVTVRLGAIPTMDGDITHIIGDMATDMVMATDIITDIRDIITGGLTLRPEPVRVLC